jgi:2-hydroxy-3-keto-5-methylthiopentenyl-1-phosphate phosphatase
MCMRISQIIVLGETRRSRGYVPEPATHTSFVHLGESVDFTPKFSVKQLFEWMAKRTIPCFVIYSGLKPFVYDTCDKV